jgi:hypothetical protein
MYRRAFRAVVISVSGLSMVPALRAQTLGGELIADPWPRPKSTSSALPRPAAALAPWSPQRTKTLDDEIIDPWRRPPSQPEVTTPAQEVADPWAAQLRGRAPPSARFADVPIVDPWSRQRTTVPTAAFPPVVEGHTTPRPR